MHEKSKFKITPAKLKGLHLNGKLTHFNSFKFLKSILKKLILC